MHGWMIGERINRWIDGWIGDEWMDRRTDGGMDRLIGGLMDGTSYTGNT